MHTPIIPPNQTVHSMNFSPSVPPGYAPPPTGAPAAEPVRLHPALHPAGADQRWPAAPPGHPARCAGDPANGRRHFCGSAHRGRKGFQPACFFFGFHLLTEIRGKALGDGTHLVSRAQVSPISHPERTRSNLLGGGIQEFTLPFLVAISGGVEQVIF